jgi:hypothetical protein
MPACDLIGQAILTGAFVIAAALLLCTRAWLHHRRMQAVLTTPDPDQEHT